MKFCQVVSKGKGLLVRVEFVYSYSAILLACLPDWETKNMTALISAVIFFDLLS